MACSPSTDLDAERTLTVLAGSDEWMFGPAHDGSQKFLLFLPLTSPTASHCHDVFANRERSGPAQGGLAETWERSEDWRSWTVRLRQDVRWHDGAPVTASDIVSNIRLWNHPDVAWYGAWPVQEVEALDERTVRFSLSEPGRWPLDGWDVFYPAHLMENREPGGFFDWDFWTRPVGNGPYRYVRHVPQTMVELEANPDYPFGKPRIERVVIRLRTGESSGARELMAGNVDMVVLEPLEALNLNDDPRFHSYYTRQGTSIWLAWNHRHPPLSDPRVRRALTQAIDRRELHRALGLPEELPLTDAPFSSCQLETGTLLPPWPHDPAAARRLLEEAGFGEGRPPLRFTLTFPSTHQRVAVLIQAELRKVGVTLDLQVLDGSLVHQRFRAGQFEAIIPGSVHVERIMAGEESPVGTPDPQLAHLMARALVEPDPVEVERLYRALGERFREVLPATYLHPRMSVLVAHRRIRGLGEPRTVVERPTWRWTFGGLEHLWIEEDEGAGR